MRCATAAGAAALPLSASHWMGIYRLPIRILLDPPHAPAPRTLEALPNANRPPGFRRPRGAGPGARRMREDPEDTGLSTPRQRLQEALALAVEHSRCLSTVEEVDPALSEDPLAEGEASDDPGEGEGDGAERRGGDELCVSEMIEALRGVELGDPEARNETILGAMDECIGSVQAWRERRRASQDLPLALADAADAPSAAPGAGALAGAVAPHTPRAEPAPGGEAEAHDGDAAAAGADGDALLHLRSAAAQDALQRSWAAAAELSDQVAALRRASAAPPVAASGLGAPAAPAARVDVGGAGGPGGPTASALPAEARGSGTLAGEAMVRDSIALVLDAEDMRARLCDYSDELDGVLRRLEQLEGGAGR